MDSKGPTTLFLFTFLTFFLLSLNTVSHAGNEDKIAFVMKALSNPFFTKMEQGVVEYAEKHQIPLEIFGIERETDIEHQISIIENLISRGYGAIILAPADSKKLIPVCQKALQQGIIVINVDAPLHKPTLSQLSLSIPFIGPDNVAGGRLIGDYVVNKLKGEGKILIIEGIRGAENADQRKLGIVEAITQNSNIKIAASESGNWHTDEALTLVTQLLQVNDSIDAILCANDSMALGAMQAVDLMGLPTSPLITGYDNIESVRTEMAGGRIHATIEQHPEFMAVLGLQSAVLMMKGQKLQEIGRTPIELVTHDTFGKKVAFSVSTLANSFFQMMLEGAKKTAGLHGIDMKVYSADNMETQQLSDIANIISDKTDLILLNPANTDSIYPGIELANSYNIPVITVDRKSSAEKVLCHIESDNTEGGRMAAQFMVNRLKKGVLLELEGIPGTSAAFERGRGFNEEIQKYPEIRISHREVANFNRNEARRITERLFKNKVPIDGVFAHNDAMILGYIDAVKAAGGKMPEVLIGFDGLPDALKLIKQNILTATIAQQPEKMGSLAVESAASFFRNEKLPARIFVDLSLITQ